MSTILKKIWEYKILLFLTLFLFFLLFLRKTAVSPPSWTPKPSPSPTTSPLPKNWEEIISRLPFKGDGWEIEYYRKTKKIAITISKGPLSEKMERAKDWLRNQGLDPEKIEILWLPTREVLKESGVKQPIPQP